MNFQTKAQSLAEYALIISVVLAAIIGMQVYVKRGLQARLKTFVDGATGTRQYEPYYTDSKIALQQLNQVAFNYAAGGRVERKWLPVVKDSEGNYIEGNVTKRAGTIKTKGVTDEDLAADNAWQN